MDSIYDGVNSIVKISTNLGETCKHCTFSIGAWSNGDNFAASIEHYINEHGYKLLHVGSETDRDDEGPPWQSTIAVVGK